MHAWRKHETPVDQAIQTPPINNHILPLQIPIKNQENLQRSKYIPIMAIRFNTKVSLLILLALSLLLLPSHSYTKTEKEQEEEQSTPEESLFKCFVKCGRHRSENDDRELSECEQRCVRKYEDRKREEREQERHHGGGGGDDDEWWSYRQIEEPRKVYERCQRDCDKHQGSSQEYQCRRACKYQYQEQKKHQQERERQHGHGGQGDEDNHHRDPEQQFKICQTRCQKQEPGQARQYCQQKCQWEREKQREQGRHHGGGDVTNRKQEKGEREETDNPYFFESHRFDSKFRTQEGHIKVLERFSKKSELLQGIENYRLAVLEANPNTFVVPHHCDAESVFLVIGGKGTISFVWQNQRHSFNLKHGDVMRVPSGSIVYLINRDQNERFYVLKFLQPVNTPGRFKDYFGVGGENTESFYTTFSNEVLEAAFNTPNERLQKLFGQQRKGVIIRASKEQIRALSQETESSRPGRGQESWAPFNLLNERPLFSNQLGQFFEAFPNDYQQLKDLDVSVGIMKIKKGAMTAPYYNSKSTRLVFVIGGSGKTEMACPHLSSQGKQQGRKEKQGETRTGTHYQRVTARFSTGDAFVVPAGHPNVIIASQDSDLQLAVFGIKGSFNQKYFLAGQENVWNQVESEAKELAFKMPAREVEEIFKKQEESYFLPGPGQREEGRGLVVGSILDFVGF